VKDIVDPTKYSEMLDLQKKLNLNLQEAYESNRDLGRDHLSKLLVNFVETLATELDDGNAKFGRIDYSGDIDFETSEQTWNMGNGVVLHFHGFSVQVSWEGADRYVQIG